MQNNSSTILSGINILVNVYTILYRIVLIHAPSCNFSAINMLVTYVHFKSVFECAFIHSLFTGYTTPPEFGSQEESCSIKQHAGKYLP